MTNNPIELSNDKRDCSANHATTRSRVLRTSLCALAISLGFSAVARAEVCSNYSGLSGIAIRGGLDRNGMGQLDLKPGPYQFQFSGGPVGEAGQFNVTVTMNGRVLKSGRIDKTAGSLTCGAPLSFTVPAGKPAPVFIHLRKVGNFGRP